MRTPSLRRVLLFTAVMILGLLPASGVSAHQNQIVEDPTVECVVNGEVTLSGHNDSNDGLDNNPSDGEYEFVDTSLRCEGFVDDDKDPDTPPTVIDAVYSVEADGDTTDISHDGKDKDGGEDCGQGGNDPDVKGVLIADLVSGSGPAHFDGTVSFHRLETAVVAFGELESDDLDQDYHFSAELQFTPTQGDCVNTPATQASLVGTAQIGKSTECAPEQVPPTNCGPK